jgi:hypothetical protein
MHEDGRTATIQLTIAPCNCNSLSSVPYSSPSCPHPCPSHPPPSVPALPPSRSSTGSTHQHCSPHTKPHNKSAALVSFARRSVAVLVVLILLLVAHLQHDELRWGHFMRGRRGPHFGTLNPPEEPIRQARHAPNKRGLWHSAARRHQVPCRHSPRHPSARPRCWRRGWRGVVVCACDGVRESGGR